METIRYLELHVIKVIESSQQYHKISYLTPTSQEETEACRRLGNFPKVT